MNKEGRGPAWNNSLFEDNAEFGMGMRLSIDKHNEYARELVARMKVEIGAELADSILKADQKTEQGINEQRERVKKLKDTLKKIKTHDSEDLLSIADYLVKKSVWIIGGDGWAYDIGYGGLDHVIASGKNGARYGSLFKHRRADVKGNRTWCSSEICCIRKTFAEERFSNAGS